jgi:hypothetical protein
VFLNILDVGRQNLVEIFKVKFNENLPLQVESFMAERQRDGGYTLVDLNGSLHINFRTPTSRENVPAELETDSYRIQVSTSSVLRCLDIEFTNINFRVV